jgi:hypothetical protein
MVGTNGPVLEVTIEDDGAVYRPGLDPIRVSPDAQLVVTVSAAPWIPVTQVRVIVNGVVAVMTDNPEEFVGVDHLGTQVVRMTRTFPLAERLPGPVDAWLIVEAGTDLPDIFDADGDGLPDLVDPGAPPNRVLSDYQAIVPGAWPVAFTNPFLIEDDGSDGCIRPGSPRDGARRDHRARRVAGVGFGLEPRGRRAGRLSGAQRSRHRSPGGRHRARRFRGRARGVRRHRRGAAAARRAAGLLDEARLHQQLHRHHDAARALSAGRALDALGCRRRARLSLHR